MLVYVSHLTFEYSSRQQLSRDKKTLEEKLQETQTALETEENKSKQEHRQRLKLESHIQDLDEKLDRETNVSYMIVHTNMHLYVQCTYIRKCVDLHVQ